MTDKGHNQTRAAMSRPRTYQEMLDLLRSYERELMDQQRATGERLEALAGAIRWYEERADAMREAMVTKTRKRGGLTAALLDVMSDGTEWETRDLARHIGRKPGDYTVALRLNRLSKEGRLVRVRQGVYRLHRPPDE